jgi:hypothetical protein
LNIYFIKFFDCTVSPDERDFVATMRNMKNNWKERTSVIDKFYTDCNGKMQKENENS